MTGGGNIWVENDPKGPSDVFVDKAGWSKVIKKGRWIK